MPFLRIQKRAARLACWARAGLLFGAVVMNSPALAQRQCVEAAWCVVADERPDGVVLWVEVLSRGEVTVRFDLDLENLRADVPLPYVATFAPRAHVATIRLSPINPAARWRYRFDTTWQHGSTNARPDDAVYLLPWAAGQTFTLIQGPGGAFSHRELVAFDWEMPERTAIRAARAGTVIATENRYGTGGPDPALRDQANYILVRHADGTVANYVHLVRGGTLVKAGEAVHAGQLIGLSGNSGFSSTPHLHFEVFVLDSSMQRRTIHIRFDLGDAGPGQPVEGAAYTALRGRRPRQ